MAQPRWEVMTSQLGDFSKHLLAALKQSSKEQLSSLQGLDVLRTRGKGVERGISIWEVQPG